MRIVALLLVLACVSQTACKTIRTTTTRQSAYSINTGDDEKKIREKYKQEFINDDEGNLVPAKRNDKGKLVPDERKRNLYSNKSAVKDGGIQKKEARLSKREVEKEQARLPEYLERQEFRESGDSAREGGFLSRLADFDSNRNRASNRTSRAQGQSSFLERLNPFGTESSASSDTTLDRKTDRRTANAISAEPVPMQNFGEAPLTNSRKREKRSVDEVKRLLNPSNS